MEYYFGIKWDIYLSIYKYIMLSLVKEQNFLQKDYIKNLYILYSHRYNSNLHFFKTRGDCMEWIFLRLSQRRLSVFTFKRMDIYFPNLILRVEQSLKNHILRNRVFSGKKKSRCSKFLVIIKKKLSFQIVTNIKNLFTNII